MQRTHFFLALSLVIATALSSTASADHQRGHNARNVDNGRYSGNGAAVTMFTKDDFRGRSVAINGAVNLKQIGFNDKADSIAIHAGTWVVCTKSDLEGRCTVLNRSIYDLDDINFDDNISSIAPYEGRRGRSNINQRDRSNFDQKRRSRRNW